MLNWIIIVVLVLFVFSVFVYFLNRKKSPVVKSQIDAPIVDEQLNAIRRRNADYVLLEDACKTILAKEYNRLDIQLTEGHYKGDLTWLVGQLLLIKTETEFTAINVRSLAHKIVSDFVYFKLRALKDEAKQKRIKEIEYNEQLRTKPNRSYAEQQSLDNYDLQNRIKEMKRKEGLK